MVPGLMAEPLWDQDRDEYLYKYHDLFDFLCVMARSRFISNDIDIA
jgi:hypothetical protein